MRQLFLVTNMKEKYNGSWFMMNGSGFKRQSSHGNNQETHQETHQEMHQEMHQASDQASDQVSDQGERNRNLNKSVISIYGERNRKEQW